MVAGPGHELAAPEGRGRGELRASHADREQVIGTLKAAFVQGMLAKDEFDQRLGQAFAARTHAELAALTADFPVNLVAAPPPEPVRAQGEQPVLRPGQALAGVTALYAGVWAFALLPPWPLDAEGDPPRAIIMLVFVATLMYLLVMVTAAMVRIDGWCEKRSGAASFAGQGEQFRDGRLRAGAHQVSDRPAADPVEEPLALSAQVTRVASGHRGRVQRRQQLRPFPGGRGRLELIRPVPGSIGSSRTEPAATPGRQHRRDPASGAEQSKRSPARPRPAGPSAAVTGRPGCRPGPRS